jgi:hypothetical protein
MRLPLWIQLVVSASFCCSAQSAVITHEFRLDSGVEIFATIDYDDGVLGSPQIFSGEKDLFLSWTSVPLTVGTTNFRFDISTVATGVVPKGRPIVFVDPRFRVVDPSVELRFSKFAFAEHGALHKGLGDFVVNSSIDFIPGHFLSASPDPTCASLSCMIPGTDEGQADISFSLTFGIPESETCLMLLLGLAVIGAIRLGPTSS